MLGQEALVVVPRGPAVDREVVTPSPDREEQFRALRQFTMAKSFDTYAPTGPVLVTPDELANRDDVKVETRLTQAHGLEIGMEMELVLVPFRTDADGNEVVSFAFRPA